MNDMKNRYISSFKHISLLLLFLWVGVSCSENKIVEQEFLELSLTSYTFNAKNAEDLVIKVNASPQWNTSLDHAAWFTVIERGEDYMVIHAEENTSIAPRASVLEVKSGIYTKYISISQLGKRDPFDQYVTFPQFQQTALSPDGKYLAGVLIQALSNTEQVYNLFRIDLTTGDQIQIENTRNYINLHMIANTGLIVGDKAGVGGYYTPEGEWNNLELTPEGRKAFVTGVSADGQQIVGSILVKNKYQPAVWKNGDVTFLPLPEKDLFDKPLAEGVMAGGCSVDGSVIYGFTSSTKVLMYWKEGEVYYAGSDIFKLGEVEKPGPGGIGQGIIVPHMDCLHTRLYGYGISPNGRYLAAFLSEADENKKESLYPAIYDIQEQKTFVVRDLANLDNTIEGEAIGVTNDRDIFYNQFEVLNEFPPIKFPVYGYAYYNKEQKSVSVSEYLKKETGMSFLSKNFMMQYYSAEGKTYYGMISRPSLKGRTMTYWVTSNISYLSIG